MTGVLKSDGGGEKNKKRKASVAFSVGSNFSKVLQGNLEVRKKTVSTFQQFGCVCDNKEFEGE